MKKILIAAVISMSMLIFAGCGDEPKPTNNDTGIKPINVEEIKVEEIRIETILTEEILTEE